MNKKFKLRTARLFVPRVCSEKWSELRAEPYDFTSRAESKPKLGLVHVRDSPSYEASRFFWERAELRVESKPKLSLVYVRDSLSYKPSRFFWDRAEPYDFTSRVKAKAWPGSGSGHPYLGPLSSSSK